MAVGTVNEIVLATGNPGKLREMQDMLSELTVEVVPQSQFAVLEVEETATTFIENAISKARNASRYAGRPAIADDSGIAVDALDGAPGVYSARYAGTGASDSDNLQKLLQDMAKVPNGQRQCRFHCTIVYMAHADDPTPEVCQGVWHGELTFEPAGGNGFGYDPVFYVPERHCTSAELPADIKNKLSPRGQAVRALIERLRAHYPDA